MLATVLVASIGICSSARALDWPDAPVRAERDLSSPSPEVRRRAAETLSSLGPAQGRELVLRAMQDSDTEVRLLATRAAIAQHIGEAVDLGLPWLLEREPRLRVAACELAMAIPSPRSVPPLARALGDGDPAVRGACAAALGTQGANEATTPLASKLDDPSPSVREQVVEALARGGDPGAVVPLIGKIQDTVPEVRQRVVRALGRIGDRRAIPALLLALRDSDVDVRREALQSLGRMRAVEAVPSIVPLAQDRDRLLREAALGALGRIATSEAVHALIERLGTGDDATADVGPTALREALVSTGSVAVRGLEAHLERPSSRAAGNSTAWILGELRSKQSAAAIVRALRRGAVTPDAALFALRKAGTAAEVPVALEYLRHSDATTRREAIALARDLLDPARPDGRAVEPLIGALRDPRATPSERLAITDLLGRTGSVRAGAALAALLDAKEDELRLAAVNALATLGAPDPRAAAGVADDALVALMRKGDARMVLHASIALGEGGGSRAEHALVASLDDGSGIDRHALARALGGMGSRRPTEALVETLKSQLDLAAGAERDAWIEAIGRVPSARALTALEEIAHHVSADRPAALAALGGFHGRPDALRIALEALRDPDTVIVGEAAFALGAIGLPEAVSSLLPLLAVRDPFVATNAALAIATIAREAPVEVRKVPDVARQLCVLLTDRKDTARVNALAALFALGSTCTDERLFATLAADDPDLLVRSAAGRILAGAPATTEARDTSIRWRSATIFVTPSGGHAPSPGAPYTLEQDGLLRAGFTDRRGAIIAPRVPSTAELMLRHSSIR